MDVVRTVEGLRNRLGKDRAGNRRIGLVPTMGGLHEGHLSLIGLATRNADTVCVSIFVNPKQFGPSEDFTAYPRDERGDLEKLAEMDVDVVFIPDENEMYPEGFTSEVRVPGLGEELEGAFRPGFFTGVATVVTKLLLQSLPDVAVFGEKDYQQLQVIKRLVTDLDIPVEILSGPIIRDADGLALSSRNAYLSEEERDLAPHLFSTLSTVAERVRKKEDIQTVCGNAEAALREAGFSRVDYVSVRDPDTLAPLKTFKGRGRVLGAAWLGRTRLIDNLEV